MSDLFPVTIDEQIAEVKRELDMRKRVYPKQIAAGGRMTQARADRATRTMQAVLETLERLKGAAP